MAGSSSSELLLSSSDDDFFLAGVFTAVFKAAGALPAFNLAAAAAGTDGAVACLEVEATLLSSLLLLSSSDEESAFFLAAGKGLAVGAGKGLAVAVGAGLAATAFVVFFALAAASFSESPLDDSSLKRRQKCRT